MPSCPGCCTSARSQVRACGAADAQAEWRRFFGDGCPHSLAAASRLAALEGDEEASQRSLVGSPPPGDDARVGSQRAGVMRWEAPGGFRAEVGLT